MGTELRSIPPEHTRSTGSGGSWFGGRPAPQGLQDPPISARLAGAAGRTFLFLSKRPRLSLPAY